MNILTSVLLTLSIRIVHAAQRHWLSCRIRMDKVSPVAMQC